MMRRTQDWGMNWLAWRPQDLWQLATLYSVPVDVMTVAGAVAAVAMLLLAKRALELAWNAAGWNPQRVLLLLWLGPPLVSALVSLLFVPVFLERTLTGTLAPAYLALAGALVHTQSRGERKFISATLALTLLSTALVTALRPPIERWPDVAAYLHRNVRPADQIWLYPADSALPLARTGEPLGGDVRAIPSVFPTIGIKGPIRAGWPAVVSVTPDQARRIAGNADLRKVPTIWLVTRQQGIFDPSGDMPAALGKVRRAGAAEDWGYIEVTPYYAR
jgi:hypothetical protein